MRTSDAVKKIVFGALGALFGSLIMSGLLGVLVQNEVIPIAASIIAAAVIAFVSVLLACLVSVRKKQKGKLTVTLMITAVFVLLQLLIGGVLFPVAEISLNWKIILPVAAAVISGVWSSTGRKRRR